MLAAGARSMRRPIEVRGDAFLLTEHDLRVLHLASQDLEGRIAFFLSEEGDLLLQDRSGETLPAGDALPRLEASGLLRRVLNRAYVLTPQGWDAVTALEEPERWLALHQGA